MIDPRSAEIRMAEEQDKFIAMVSARAQVTLPLGPAN
jgi:hypothetical protein